MRRLLILPLLLAGPAPTLAQSGLPEASPKPLPWYRPTHLIGQTAGGMGMMALGAGYDFWRNRGEADLLVGLVPKKYAGSTLSVGTAKFLYTPFTVPLGEKLQLRPLTVGLYLSYTHGTINDEDRGQYTKGYYWFSSDTRFGPLLGGRLTYLQPSSSQRTLGQRISAYYELGTNDLYLISYYLNTQALSPADILTLGLGLKVDF